MSRLVILDYFSGKLVCTNFTLAFWSANARKFHVLLSPSRYCKALIYFRRLECATAIYATWLVPYAALRPNIFYPARLEFLHAHKKWSILKPPLMVIVTLQALLYHRLSTVPLSSTLLTALQQSTKPHYPLLDRWIHLTHLNRFIRLSKHCTFVQTFHHRSPQLRPAGVCDVLREGRKTKQSLRNAQR